MRGLGDSRGEFALSPLVDRCEGRVVVRAGVGGQRVVEPEGQDDKKKVKMNKFTAGEERGKAMTTKSKGE